MHWQRVKNCRDMLSSRSPWLIATLFGVVWAGAAVIFYWRFPNNLAYPNFYAEDGSILARNILEHGFWHALMITFNGYYIWGLYLLEGGGFALNTLLFGAQLVDLPKAFAIMSYTFLGLIAASPIVFLRRYMSVGWRLVVALAITLVPLPMSDYAIVGTIGNLKFLFVPLALMLILYRVTLPRHHKRLMIVDFGLGLCAYTNVAVYAILPALLLGDGLRPRQLRHLRQLLRRDNVSLWSALGLATIVSYQLIVVATQGIPATPGYLDAPLQKHTLIEIGVARSYLFPLVYWCYHYLSDLVALGLFATLIALIVRYGQRAHYWAYGLILGTVILMTSLFVATRPGVTGLFEHYANGGPDQFFFGQNILAIIAIGLLLADITCRLQLRWRRAIPIAAAILILLPAAQAGSYGRQNFMQRNIGTIKASAQNACTQAGDQVNLALYPVAGFYLSAPRAQVCTPEVAHYQPEEVNLGLTPQTPELVLLSITQAKQTFVSPRDNLNGISLYLGTYANTHITAYQLKVYDATCQNVLRTALLSSRVTDNSSLDIRFSPIGQSAKHQYCFQIYPLTSKPSPLAARLSAPNIYPTGRLTLGGQESPRDLVFSLLYPSQN